MNNKFSQNKIALIALSMLPISYKKKSRLLECVGEAKQLLSLDGEVKEAFCSVCDLTAFGEFCDVVKNLDSTENRLNNEGVVALTLEDNEYPNALKEIDDAPILLYAKGNLDALKRRAVAVVGTRKPTRYGERVTEDFVGEFAKAGLTVVSGFARGIDSVAHRACVRLKSPTVGVLASGVNVCYPAENRQLMEDMLSCGGLFLSEYPLGVKPLNFFFPERNRIISGLSEGVFLAEATEKSGSLITVGYANDQGREVYIVPANVNSPASAGSNRALRELKGNLVLCPEDVLESIGVKKQNEEGATAVQLSILEQQLWDTLYVGETHFEELLTAVDCPAHEVSSALMNLELFGLVDKLPGNYYVRR